MDEQPPDESSVAKARRLRGEMSLPEVMLWQVLRRKQQGFRFRRQHPAKPYFYDFYCASAKLVIEVDGAAHDMGDNPARDAIRDAVIRKRGLRILRIPASEVLADLGQVVEGIVAACRGA